MAHLEDCFDSSNATVTRRALSYAKSELPTQEDASTRMLQTNNTLELLPYGTSAHFQFERVLLASRVYIKAERHASDASFRSSIGRSHAWTALSDISLSDISKISVIALPIHRHDISNPEHFEFRLPTLKFSDSISELERASAYDFSHETKGRPRMITSARPDSVMSLDAGPDASDPSKLIIPYGSSSTRLMLYVKSGKERESHVVLQNVCHNWLHAKSTAGIVLTLSSMQPQWFSNILMKVYLELLTAEPTSSTETVSAFLLRTSHLVGRSRTKPRVATSSCSFMM